VLADGDICIGTLNPGGISVFPAKGGAPTFMELPDHAVTNICFGGKDRRTAYITGGMSGKLFKMEWPKPGLRLNYNA
jgi:gluconolactonase